MLPQVIPKGVPVVARENHFGHQRGDGEIISASHFLKIIVGFRALVEKRFDDRIFAVSFLSNVLIAAFLVFLGDQLGVGAQISTGVVVVLAMRIFANAAAIRRLLFRA